MVRKSNFELMRIIAILMIIGLHYFNGSMGGALQYTSGVNRVISYFFESFFIIGVNLFILVVGYFNFKKKNVNIVRLFNLLLLAYFYGAMFYLVEIFFGYEKFNLINFIKAINPFLGGSYWFIKYYIILNLLIPFINIVLNQINRQSTYKLIGILIVLFSIWPSFLIQPPITDGGYGLMNFILLYIIGATIRKYGLSSENKGIYLVVYFICSLFNFLISLSGFEGRCWSYNFLFNIVGSTSLFIWFSYLNIQSKRINYLSGYTFSIYLIHFSPFMIKALYHNILRCQDYYNSHFFLFHFIISVSIIYICSCLIDTLRRKGLSLINSLFSRLLGYKPLYILKEKMNKFKILDFSIND